MKKILLISSLFTTVTLLADSGILASRYCGGGTEYFEILESDTNLNFAYDAGLENNKVIIDNANDLPRYAGWDGADIGINFQPNQNKTKQVIEVNANWTIKNKFIVRSENFTFKNDTQFIVRNGSTLTMQNLVGNTKYNGTSFVSFYGQNDTGVVGRNKIILTLSNTDGDAATATENSFGNSVLKINYVDMEYTNSYLELSQLMMDGNAKLSLSSDMKVNKHLYSTKNNNVIALNGNELDYSNGKIKCEGTAASELVIDYSNGAGTFLVKDFAQDTSASLYLKDFNYLEDFLIFSSSSVDKTRIFFKYDEKTYTGDDILVKDLGNDQYSYYVIPEPSTYAGIFGFVALGFALYRRRK